MVEAGVAYVAMLRITDDAGGKLKYLDNAIAWQTIQAVSNEAWYHIELVWRADDTMDIWVDGVKQVDNVATAQAMTSGVDNFGCGAYGDSTEYIYFDAHGDISSDKYTLDDNLKDTICQYSGNMGPPAARKTQMQYNTWIIYGGINPVTGKPYEKNHTTGAHILKYGELIWNGRNCFPEARTQSDLDDIATGLEAWQGMQNNPDDAIVTITQKGYYPVGREISFTFTYLDQFATTQDMLIASTLLDFKKKLNKCVFSTNIVRKL